MKAKHHAILSAPVTRSGDKTLNNTIYRQWYAAMLGALLFSALTALLPSPAQAQCQRWNVSGLWELRVGDEDILILNVQQEWQGQSARLTGTFTRELTPEGAKTKSLSGINSGKLSGKLERTSFTMEVTYPSFTSRYTGKINPNTGRMEGTEEGGMNHHWVSSKTFSCGGSTPSATVPTTRVDANNPNQKGRGFINGLNLPTPAPTPKRSTKSQQADEAASDDTQDQQNDTQDQHKKNKKNKKKHHRHHDDDQQPGND